jgi:energy-coupling factor transporter ATP-binding protein EcfA2
MWRWAKANAKALSFQLRHGISSNLAAILNEDHDALDACVTAFVELCPDMGIEEAARNLVAAAKEEPMTWLDLSGHGLPPPYGRELTPVADARAEAAKGDANPSKYLFNVSANRYEILQADGSYLPDILPDALATMLAPTIGDRKAIERFMKTQIPNYKKRAPVYESTERLVKHNGLMTFNTFVPTRIVPREGDWSNIRALVMNLVGEDRREEAFEFFLDWLALVVQRIYVQKAPQKMLTAVVLHGEQGSGKGTLVEVLQMLYPEGSVITVDQERLEERFSSWNADTLLLVANEVNSGTTKEKALANKLKRLITDPTVVVEEKGEKAQPNAKNKMTLLFCSNDDRPVRIERGDRRFIVFHSRTKLPQLLIKALRADMNGPRTQVAAFFHHLLHRQVQIEVNSQFETAAWRLMQNASLSTVEKAVDELRVVGYRSLALAWEKADDIRQNEVRVATAIGSVDGCEHIPSGELVSVIKYWARRQGLSIPDNIEVPLRNAMKAAFPEAKADRASLKGRRQERVWLGLPLDIDPDGKVTRLSGEKAPYAVPSVEVKHEESVPPGTAEDFSN